MRRLLTSVVLLTQLAVFGQGTLTKAGARSSVYRATDERINNVEHAKLDVRFDYAKSYLSGKVWLTLKPHFYATDSLRLDAKGMTLSQVSLAKNNKLIPLKHEYDGMNLRIKLDRSYSRLETYQVYVEYTAKPNEYKGKGSQAIQDAKGLYFINPLGTEKNKPTQIWTQGETEATSVWVPIIDKPNQKCTQEITMTVPSKYVTLSNGKLMSQKVNKDGTRTDHWKMDLPHSPYLFFMGVGEYAIIRDSYKGKEVSYYVEKEYAGVARKIFGETPAMMRHFSQVLGVEYPWIKYAQIVGRDYVSGAMENTTATLHREALQQNARELVDGNQFEDYISHELFHQWFGDLVTAESWSNLTVNESMANYSEVIWLEHRYGKDAADAHNYKDMQAYASSLPAHNDNLVRFNYNDKEQMFDLVSYNKGGRIVHMLRNYIGDSAFFKGLNLYLKTHKFKNTEATHLRLAFEEVTGKDLNWFWNQWYYSSGHPRLEISYGYDATTTTASVYLKQTQNSDNAFKLPFAIDIYSGQNRQHYNVETDRKTDTFTFKVLSKPDLINVDADKVLLAEKKDTKTAEAYMLQYKVGNYVDRREALEYAIKNRDSLIANSIIELALADRYYELRERALSGLNASKVSEEVFRKVRMIAEQDEKRTTRAEAIDLLARKKDSSYRQFFLKALFDSSYSVAGAALEALMSIDEEAVVPLLPKLQQDARGRLAEALKLAEVLTFSDKDFDRMTLAFDSASMYEKFVQLKTYLTFLGNVTNSTNFHRGVDRIIAFRDRVASFSKEYKDEINKQLTGLKNKKLNNRKLGDQTTRQEQAEYIDRFLKEKS
ncbi:M1 family peptidase [Segetibacter sp. 3557_3]|uniref:M1 family metallopeptidase n=1 Tax=Segetibacter sp. 3557_3 TaxID=2547429 RepID=UPI001058B88D|nr:M1 family metallopeptidase [Segetibacter sp. 3557_3]TDH26045.1 M1 family peptidase [Segetibacter sp. 3557_3]